MNRLEALAEAQELARATSKRYLVYCRPRKYSLMSNWKPEGGWGSAEWFIEVSPCVNCNPAQGVPGFMRETFGTVWRCPRHQRMNDALSKSIDAVSRRLTTQPTFKSLSGV